MIKAVFYDFDGVIKESTDIKSKAFYELYLPFGKQIAQMVVDHHIAHGGVSRFEKIKFYHKSHLNQDLSEEQIQEWANRFSKLVLEKVVNSLYVVGAIESIKRLSNKIDQFIITGTPQNEIEFICNELGISGYFLRICGSPIDKIKWSKVLLEEFGYQSKDVLFIGDASTDFEAAKHHSFHFLLREHEENTLLFENVPVNKVNDLLSLEQYIYRL